MKKIAKVKLAPKRELNAVIKSLLADAEAGSWALKTEFAKRADGGWRCRVVRADGAVEKEEVIPVGASPQKARAGTGFSQARFARLIGVSLRTLQEWEQGRKRPSGPASALLRIVASNPQVVAALQ